MSINLPTRADHVGSFLRPITLKQARANFEAGKITQQELTAIEDAEIKKLVEQEIQAGLIAITDGEFRRSWWHYDFLENLIGTEAYTPEEDIQFHGKKLRRHGVRLIGKIAFNPAHPFFEHFVKLKEIVGDRGIPKQTIPSPNQYLQMFPTFWDNQTIYTDFEDFKQDLIKAYQQTIQKFYDLGCRYLQIDDVYWASLCAEEPGTKREENIKHATEILQAILSEKPQDLTLTTHVCRGNFRSTWHYSGPYDAVAESLFGKLNYDGYFLEYDSERAGDFKPLEKFTGDGRVVLGLLTSKLAALESKETIKERIKEASQYIPLEQLCLSLQCGFASTEEGNDLTQEEQWAKIKHVIAIAKEVWKDA